MLNLLQGRCQATHRHTGVNDVGASTRQQHAATAEAATGRGHCDLRTGDLATPRMTPELRHRLVEQPKTVETPGRQLPPVGVERQLAIKVDPPAAIDERASLAFVTEPQRL